MHILPSQLAQHEQASREIVRVFGDAQSVMRHAPALFATSGHPKMSSKYGYTNTYALLNFLIQRGFVLRFVQQTGKGAYGKVMIRMTHPAMARTNDGEAQLVIIDSHDGTSSLKLMLGWFRFICANGMIIGDTVFSRRFKHNQDDLIEQVLLDLDDAVSMSEAGPASTIARMQRMIISPEQLVQLANHAARLRFEFDEDAEHRYTRVASALLSRRRQEDAEPNLYVAMNVVQENALRGGVTYTYRGDAHKIKPITAINAQMVINQGIWQAAANILEGKAA